VRQLDSAGFLSLASGVYQRLHGGGRPLQVPVFAKHKPDLHTVGVEVWGLCELLLTWLFTSIESLAPGLARGRSS
jgi:hypothetical protein